MSEIIYYTLDTETTGLDSDKHEIVEISIIRCSDKLQITRTIKAKNPRNASLEALKITGKTLHDLYNGIEREEAIQHVHDFFSLDNATPEARCVVAHNAPFDQAFVHAMWDSCNKSFPANLWIDSLAICRNVAKQDGHIKPKLKLANACELFGVQMYKGAHNAKSDTRNAYQLWKKFEERGVNFIDYIKRIPHYDESLLININEYEEESTHSDDIDESIS